MPVSLRDIDLKLLRVFIAVVESGGFTPAQAVLNLSSSRLSTLIADLEGRLGMRLCQRGRTGFRLTEKGQGVYRAAQKLMGGLEGFRADIGVLRGKLVGNLTIGLVDNVISNPAARIADSIGRYCRRAPDIHVTMHIDAPQELEQKVLDGRIELGIGAFHHSLPGLKYRALFLEEQTLYCGKAHPLFAHAPDGVTDEALQNADYAGRGYREESRPIKFQTKASSYSMEGLALLVLSGRFIAYLPSHYAAHWVENGLMRPLLPRRLSYQSLFEVATKRGSQHSPALAAFLDDLLLVHAKQTQETIVKRA